MVAPASGGAAFDPAAVRAFRYDGVDVDEAAGRLRLRYALVRDAGAGGDLAFEEVIGVGAHDGPWPAAAHEAARLVHLLAGVSYYKVAAPPVVDLAATPVRDGEAAVLRDVYVEGLGEYAYRNDLDLSGLQVVGGVPAGPAPALQLPAGRPLVPFGGGIDSIVVVDAVVRDHPDAALFVLSRPGARFAAIEDAAAVTGLPVLRAARELDPKVLRSAELGYRNGHVPVTGILSAIAVLVAVLHGRDRVVMSNEWSASIGNLEHRGRTVNHQWSKSMAFETAFRDVLAGAMAHPPAYFSLLRARSELWVARRFAELEAYHGVFRSCNRAFHLDPARRLDRWCGRCDKCCFIDLVLAPYLPAEALRRIFDGAEPLDQPELRPQFEALLGLSADVKPFECVGDEGECRAAASAAAARPDRQGTALLQALAAAAPVAPEAVERLLRPLGPDHVPADLVPADQPG